MNVKLHWAERFLNWYPANTKLYVRKSKGVDYDRFKLDRDLFHQLVPFLDKLRNEALAEGKASAEETKEELC